MTITRTFGTKLAPSYVAGTIVEVVHFRDMIFEADEMVAIYLDAVNASMDLGSFNIAKFPEYEGDESDTEKVLILNKSEAESNKLGLKILTRKNNTGNWEEDAEIILVNRGRKDYLDWRSYTGFPTRIMEKSDAIAVQLVDYGDGLLWDTDFIKVKFGCTIEVSKKNDLTALTNRLAALESLLGLFGAATPTAAGTNGLVKGAAIGQQDFLLKGDRTWQNPAALPVSAAATTAINSAVAALVASSPVALDTLSELAAAIGNDANFATTVTNLIGSKVGKSGNETIGGDKTFTGATLFGNRIALLRTTSQMMTNPSFHPSGIQSTDTNLGDGIKGWHLLTLIRSDNVNYGVQIALCDTSPGIKYRNLTGGTWNSWITIL